MAFHTRKKHAGDVRRERDDSTVQALAFFVEIGPLVAASLLGGRVAWAWCCARQHAGGRQIDAIESYRSAPLIFSLFQE